MTQFLPISDRNATRKIASKAIMINIIVCYPPTSASTGEEIELFHEQVKTTIKYTKKQKK